MNTLMSKLNSKQQRGSKPRCHWITNGSNDIVASRLSAMTTVALVSPDDVWLPRGFHNTEEAKLHKANGLLQNEDHTRVLSWWLKHPGGTTPNFDIASTCNIDGKNDDKKGVLLVEAKAHLTELEKEKAGKPLKKNASSNTIENHDRIGESIASVSRSIDRATITKWRLSRDKNYQMSNRFAFAIKLAQLGYSSVVAYLGFVNANEMRDRGLPFQSHEEWKKAVLEHSREIMDESLWGTEIPINNQTIRPIICSVEMPHDKPCSEIRFDVG